VRAAGGRVAQTTVLDCALMLVDGARHGERVQVHHGTRDAPGRLADLGGGLWQLRLERPVLAADGDRVVVRRLSPPDTLGGGIILDAGARRHGRRPEVLQRLRARAQGRPEPEAGPAQVTAPTDVKAMPAPDPEAVLLLDTTLREAGLAMLNATSLGAVDTRALAALRADGRAVRISGQLYAHADLAADVQARIIALIEATGSTSLAEVRDALGAGRKSAQAFLEYLDAGRVTRRQPDDRRVLGRRAVTGSAR
jgi:selenocysteine-specific elongation factor